jgi:Flp pilus assembly protein TadG
VSIKGSRRSARHSDRGRGQALVEFALVVPLFLLLVAGMVDFGMGLASSIAVTNAAREGARLGIITPNATAIDNRARAIALGLDQTKVTVTSTCSRPAGSSPSTCTLGTWKAGDSVVVKVDYNYQMIWPLAMGNTINMSSSAQMRLE